MSNFPEACSVSKHNKNQEQRCPRSLRQKVPHHLTVLAALNSSIPTLDGTILNNYVLWHCSVGWVKSKCVSDIWEKVNLRLSQWDIITSRGQGKRERKKRTPVYSCAHTGALISQCLMQELQKVSNVRVWKEQIFLAKDLLKSTPRYILSHWVD